MLNASTQEKIAAYVDKLKTSIVDFVEKSGLIDKITGFVDWLSNPKNMQGVLNTIKGVIANAIDFFGSVASSVADLISHLPFTDTEKWKGISESIVRGTAGASAAVRGVGGSSFGSESVSGNAASSTVAQSQTVQYTPAAVASATGGVNLYVVGERDLNGRMVYKQVDQSHFPSFDKTTLATAGNK
jgi:hypothetical protein